MTREQEKQLEEHFETIDESGESVITTRNLLFHLMGKLNQIEDELDRKDRTSKKELRLILKESKHTVFEALKRIKGE